MGATHEFVSVIENVMYLEVAEREAVGEAATYFLDTPHSLVRSEAHPRITHDSRWDGSHWREVVDHDGWIASFTFAATEPDGDAP